MSLEFVRHYRSGRVAVIRKRAIEAVRSSHRPNYGRIPPVGTQQRRYIYVDVPVKSRDGLETRRWRSKLCRTATSKEYCLYSKKQGIEYSMS